MLLWEKQANSFPKVVSLVAVIFFATSENPDTQISSLCALMLVELANHPEAIGDKCATELINIS
jgi:hypothetical protein